MQYKALVFDFFGVVFLGFRHFDHELLAYIQDLRAQGIKVGLLSNAPSIMRDTLLRVGGIPAYFDAIVLSGDIGHAKPAPEAYRAILEKLAVAPGDALMIDDHESKIRGAEAVGMHGHLYTSFAELTQALAVVEVPSHAPPVFDTTQS